MGKMPKIPKGKLHADVDVATPKAGVVYSDSDDDERETTCAGRTRKSKANLKTPKMGKTSKIEVQASAPEIQMAGVDAPSAVISAQLPTVDVGVDAPSLPKVGIEVKTGGKDVTSDEEEESGAKKKAKFGLKMPK